MRRSPPRFHRGETCDATASVSARRSTPAKADEVEEGSTPPIPTPHEDLRSLAVGSPARHSIWLRSLSCGWGSTSRVGNPASSLPHRRASTPHICGSLRGSLRSPFLRSHRFAHKSVLASLRSVSGGGSPSHRFDALRGSLRFPTSRCCTPSLARYGRF